MKRTMSIAKAILFCSIAAFSLFIQGCTKNKEPELVYKISSDENGYTDVYTNDYTYCGYIIPIATNDLSAFLVDSIVTKVNKVSGYSKGMFGLYFNGSGTETTLSNFCSVLIDTEGSYMIMKCVNNVLYALNSSGNWVTSAYSFTSSDLIKGYNKINSIKVVVSAPKYYQLYFNHKLVNTFYEPQLTSGLKKGYLFDVASASNEGFPNSYLQIKFLETNASKSVGGVFNNMNIIPRF